jgi:hypothetical protein
MHTNSVLSRSFAEIVLTSSRMNTYIQLPQRDRRGPAGGASDLEGASHDAAAAAAL